MCTEWHVSMAWEFSQALSEKITSARQTRVLITNFLSNLREMGNPRDDAITDEMLMLYLGQYKIQRAFSTVKSEFKVDSVYILASRANTFILWFLWAR